MKNAKLLTLLLLALVFNLSSCNDDEGDPTPISTKESFLTAKKWKIAEIMFDGDTVTTDPDVATVRSTQVKFNTDGTYTQVRTDGTETGTWKFTNDETHLVYGPSASEQQDWEITELIDNSFKANSVYTFPDYDPIDVTIEMVYAE